jgi:hypothetical protein
MYNMDNLIISLTDEFRVLLLCGEISDCREKFQSSLHNSSSESFPVNHFSNAFLTLYEGCVDVRLQEDI